MEKRGGWRPGAGRKPKQKLPFDEVIAVLDRVRHEIESGTDCLRRAAIDLAAARAAIIATPPLLNPPGPTKTIRPPAADASAALPRDIAVVAARVAHELEEDLKDLERYPNGLNRRGIPESVKF